MLVYLLKRLAAMLPTLLGITLLTFLIVNCAPGDPVGATLEGGGADGAGAEGGGTNPDQMADAIKAKKKLLGMVTEDYSLQTFDGELGVDDRVGELDAWPRSLLLHNGMLLAGAADGTVHQVADGVSWDVEVVGKVQALAARENIVAVGTSEGELLTLDLNGGVVGRISPLDKGIRALAVLEDRLLVGADDGVIRVYSMPELTYEAKLEGHIAGVYDIEVGEGRFWSAGYDRILREWDAETLTVTRTSEAHGQAVNDLALSPDGTMLATACDDRKAYVFDLTDLDTPTHVLPNHYKRVSSVAWAGPTLLYTGSHDELVRSWDLSVAEPVALASPEKIGRIHDLVVLDGQLYSAADGWKEVPVIVRYFKWLSRIATLDFDRSFVDEQPVIDKIAKALPVTLLLNVISISLIYLISIPLGVLAAVKRGSMFDHVSSVLLFMLYSLPNFWLATLLIMGFSSKQTWDILPSVGLHANNANDLSYLPWLGDSVLHLVLPIICMTYAGFASLSRYTRTSLLETIQADYVRTARAKGLAETVVVLKHALRNALITIVTLIGNLLPRMIGGSVIIEYIFTIDGMGKLGFDAILTRDYPVIMAITTFSALLTLVGILVSDLLYSAVDPRVTAE
jgi:peptide/nickel transport system permease protein